MAADVCFYSQANENKVQEMRVSWVAVPNHGTHSEERQKLQMADRGAKAASTGIARAGNAATDWIVAVIAA